MSNMSNQEAKFVVVDVLGEAGVGTGAGTGAGTAAATQDPQVRDATVPMIYADDLAAVRGDGVFETFMLRGGNVRNRERHATRFLNSSAMLDLPEPNLERWFRATDIAVADFEEKNGPGQEAALRWVYSRGRESTGQPTGWVTVAPVSEHVLHDREHGVRVMTAERGFRIDLSERSPWALIGAKTLSYAANMAALRSAKARGVDDVIFLSDEGLVLEGPTSTVVAAEVDPTTGEKKLVTPPAHVGILKGTSQAALFKLAEQRGWVTEERVLRVEDLTAAVGVWLVSSVRVQARVTELDGTQLPRPEVADEVEKMAWEAVTG